MNKYVIIVMISTFFFSINTLIQRRTPQIDSSTFMLISFAVSTLFVLFYRTFFTPVKEINLHSALWATVAGLLAGSAYLMFNIGIRNYRVSTVVVINSFGAALTILLAYILFAEKLSLTQIIGVILGTTGVILVSL